MPPDVRDRTCTAPVTILEIFLKAQQRRIYGVILVVHNLIFV